MRDHDHNYQAGADVFEVCKAGDDFILAETAKVYNKRQKLDENDTEALATLCPVDLSRFDFEGLLVITTT